DACPAVRVLLATPRFAPQVGGAETWTLEVCAGLASRGHLVEAIARAAPEAAASGSIRGVEVRRVPGGRVTFARGIARAVGAAAPDVVLAQYSALAPAVVAGRRRGVPVVGVVHDVYGLAESVRIRGPAIGVARYLGLERSLGVLRPDAFLAPSSA